MTTLLAGLVLLKGSQALAGPKILVNMSNGRSFTIQTDAKNAPKTVAGIVTLVKKGFYNDQRVHRVEPGFVVQWGDPKSKNGVDSPLVGSGQNAPALPFEPGKLKFVAGTVGIASTGRQLGGDCQLFVMLGASPGLNGDYSAMGKVVSGMNVVAAIQKGDKILSMKIVK